MYGEESRARGYDAPMVNLIHDEIVIDAHKSVAKEAGELLKKCMEDACKVVINEFEVICELEYVK